MKRRKYAGVTCRDYKKFLSLMKAMLVLTKVTGKEHGFTAYKSPRTGKVVVTERCVGNECKIYSTSGLWISISGNMKFHTHPDWAVLSQADIISAAAAGVDLQCVGALHGRIRGIRCYRTPPNLSAKVRAAVARGAEYQKDLPSDVLTETLLMEAAGVRGKLREECVLWKPPRRKRR